MAKPEKYLMLPATAAKAVSTHKGQVVIELDLSMTATLPDGSIFAIRMAPEDARSLANLILSQADIAESGQVWN